MECKISGMLEWVVYLWALVAAGMVGEGYLVSGRLWCEQYWVGP